MKAILLVATFLFVAYVEAKTPPTWPTQYYVSGTFSIPYFEIVEPIEMFYDGVNNRELINYYNGMDSYLWRFDTQTLYQVIPRIDQLKCFVSNGIGAGPLTTLLPNIATWTYRGMTWKNGVSSDKWENTVTNFNKTAVYTMYTNSQNGNPVQLHLNGYDFVFGSHPDIYIMDFNVYKANYVNASVFDPIPLCNTSKAASTASVHRSRAILGRFASLTPPELTDHFDLFIATHKKVYSDKKEYEYRRSIFENNMKHIHQHNSRSDVSFKLSMNHLGDLTREEVSQILMPRPQGVNRYTVNSNAVRYHQKSQKTLPDSINWIDLGAVTKVKDQGVCGSCWTFGTTGALEGAYFMKTGKLVSLSEQQIVDCAWGTWVTGNSGCDGGFAGPAFDWIQANGGIALEDTYKYLMMDHWCNAFDQSSGVTVSGYVNITEFSEADLQDALATVGPVTVAIDASHPEFSFYTSGVYFQSNCGSTPDQLDHQVLVVGYGTENGQDYWLVKNSWSTHWGNQGYVKMARNRNNNCGIATQANYPLI